MIARRLHAWLLRSYPPPFQKSFGAELQHVFDERLCSARRRGRAHALWFVIWACGDTIVSGAAERWAARPKTPRRSPAMIWSSVAADVRSAFRLIRHAPVFAAVATLVLALGIGANGAIFAAVDSVLLRPLPYHDPDRLVMIWSNNTNAGNDRNVVSPADYLDVRAQSRSFSGVEALQSFLVPDEYRDGGEPDGVQTSTVSIGLFDVLGRAPLFGRSFRDGDRDVVLLSHAFWQKRYGSRRDILGRPIRLTGAGPATIVGVMPADFVFPYRTMLGPSGFTRAQSADVWVPMVFEGRFFRNPDGSLARQARFLGLIARLSPDATIDTARADLSTVTARLAAQYPRANAGWGATIVGLLDQTVGPIKPALLLLLAGVGIVLLMACANVASLLLARQLARQRDSAVRTALGASRSRLIQQSVIESLTLALAGAAAGALLLYGGVHVMVAVAPPETPRLQEIAPRLDVFLFTLGSSLVAGVIAGLIPGFAGSRAASSDALKDGGRGMTRSAVGGRLRNRLIVGEVALAVVLTAGSLLLLRSFVAVLQVDPGFQSQQLLTFQINAPPRLNSAAPVARTQYYDELFARLDHIPGVDSTGATTRLPLGSTNVSTLLQVEGRDVPAARLPEVELRRAQHHFFEAMGIPLLAGRLFTEADGPDAPPVAIINRALDERVFPAGDALGHRVRIGTDASGMWTTIVGVVGNIRHASLEEPPRPEFYISGRQGPPFSPYLVVRFSGDAASVASAIRREVRALDSSVPIYDLRTMSTVRGDAMSARRFILLLVGAFGIVALTLAAVGMYGVMALAVSERRSEIGVRLALGATPRVVMALILRRALVLVATGVAIGLVGAALAAPLISHHLFGVSPFDPAALLGTAALLIGIGALATFVPARRAMKVDPVVTLREPT